MEKVVIGKNMVKSYGKGTQASYALNGVNIEITAGEFVAVMGPSGCGKSTLMFALSGTDTINSGEVNFDGAALSRLTQNALADIRRKKIGFVFQYPTMLKNLNIIDNIMLPALQDKQKKTDDIARKARALMQKTGLSGLETRDITEVSGGQLQRAGICRALMNKPKIVFADEPTGALNSKTSEEIMSLFSRVNQEGTAILLVTHDAKIASRAERVLFMKDGQIQSELRLGKFESNQMEKRMSAVTLQMQQYGI